MSMINHKVAERVPRARHLLVAVTTGVCIMTAGCTPGTFGSSPFQLSAADKKSIQDVCGKDSICRADLLEKLWSIRDAGRKHDEELQKRGLQIIGDLGGRVIDRFWDRSQGGNEVADFESDHSTDDAEPLLD